MAIFPLWNNDEGAFNVTKSLLIITASVVLGGMLAACSSTPENVLAVVGSDTLHVADYEQLYSRSKREAPTTDSARREFFDRMVGYHLKLAYVTQDTFKTSAALKQEMTDYRNQLAVNFLLEKEMVEPSMKVMYDRRFEEIEVSHILFKFGRGAEGSIDTAIAYMKAVSIFPVIQTSPLPFDSLAMLYSDDAKKEDTRGRVGWLLAGTTFPQVDDMIYSLKPGDIAPHPVRTPYGYHVFKIHQRRKALQRIRGSHILYRLDPENPVDTAAGMAKLTLVLDSLLSGKATYEELAQRNSQDPVSGPKGGDLGWMERGSLDQTFEAALFHLQNGQISGIVRSAFGLHIIKRVEDGLPRSFEEQKSNMRRMYMGERFVDDFHNFAKRQRERFGFAPSRDVIATIVSRMDSTMTTSTPEWEKRLSNDDKKAYFYRLDGKGYTVQQCVEEIKSDPALQMRPFTLAHMDTLAMLLANKYAMIKATEGLEQRYPEFAAIIQEYTESALIAEAETREVESRITITDEMVKDYWERHKTEFRWPDRLSFSEIFVYGREIAMRLLDSLKLGASFTNLAKKYSKRGGVHNTGGSWGLVAADFNDLSRFVAGLKVGQIAGPYTHDVGFSILRLDSFEPAREKNFSEARQEAKGRLKDELLQQGIDRWVQQLRSKFPVTEFPEHLSNVFVKKEGTGAAVQ